MRLHPWTPLLLPRSFALVAALLAGVLGPAHAAESLDRDVFVSGEGGYHTYRIPSLLTARDGSLLAFCEGRKKSASDSGDIALLLKRSTDGGVSWGPQQVVWDDPPNTCGNPCPVVDQTRGAIWLLMTHNPGRTTERQINEKKGAGTRTVWLSKSTDNGKTWTAPVDISASVKGPTWNWYATGPGIGIQLQHGPHQGRLVVPCDHSCQRPKDAPPDTPIVGGSHVIYSDDHGQTWGRGGEVEPGMNECQVAELADGKGSLLLNMRNGAKGNQRSQAISHDGGESWSQPEPHPQLVEPRCQASLLRYTWPGDTEPGRMLFCNPAGLGRTNLTIRVSYDGGKSWPRARTLHPGPSAYSSLAVLPDKSVGCLYECGEAKAYERIRFLRAPLSWMEGKN